MHCPQDVDAGQAPGNEGGNLAATALAGEQGGVIRARLFGGSLPECFGSVGSALCTLFAIMTAASRSMGIVRPVMDADPPWRPFPIFIFVFIFILRTALTGRDPSRPCA
ncbi:hypothetical protein [Accumulibacter sp.]|uniref:hypothetical protein n=1 Tax=Accumulibacter sp. TaxID=2053492 RepID=UPI00261F84B8|nr:hypothetical protein [Accumulibacter sp.]